jgi:hypothetical protein
MKPLLIFALSLFAALATAIAAPAADVAGKWHIVLDTPGGDREVEASFALDGEKVTGKFGDTDVAGTFKDGKIDLVFPMHSEEAGTDGTFKLSGKLDADALTGTWEFSEYNGTFKAARKE